MLNAFPYPWLTSMLSLAAGSAIMLASWATRIAEAPDGLDFWKALSSGGDCSWFREDEHLSSLQAPDMLVPREGRSGIQGNNTARRGTAASG
ncbi:hypothetical protein QYE76_005420 [Lolium multiflorum]|uniref:Uncharacterized protein n=1 Tax=Lolium multiflorum TaxID=4521 RepID=A0AAD8RTU5_LOLMU|nr:hypothetical protein QYE76_005420 [Lolium multiflorum]